MEGISSLVTAKIITTITDLTGEIPMVAIPMEEINTKVAIMEVMITLITEETTEKTTDRSEEMRDETTIMDISTSITINIDTMSADITMKIDMNIEMIIGMVEEMGVIVKDVNLFDCSQNFDKKLELEMEELTFETLPKRINLSSNTVVLLDRHLLAHFHPKFLPYCFLFYPKFTHAELINPLPSFFCQLSTSSLSYVIIKTFITTLLLTSKSFKLSHFPRTR